MRYNEPRQHQALDYQTPATVYFGRGVAPSILSSLSLFFVLTMGYTSKAAALLIHRLGFRTVKAGILSRLGEAVFHRYEITYTYEQLVDRIRCQTEELLAEVEDPEAAYRLVKVRAGR